MTRFILGHSEFKIDCVVGSWKYGSRNEGNVAGGRGLGITREGSWREEQPEEELLIVPAQCLNLGFHFEEMINNLKKRF